MKKAKILAVFGILLAMGLTACNKDSGGDQGGQQGGDVTSQEQQQSAGQESQQTSGGESQASSEHKHSYGEWTRVTEPTCTEKGSEERVCECGDKQTRSVNALGHDWGEWAPKTAATCTEDGVEERTCKRAGCGAKEERAVKAAHDWDAETTVEAGTDPADQVSYKLAVCKKGDAIKADITAVDAKFYKGKIKSSTPTGYFKLNSTNDKAYWKFTVPGTKMYKGMLYERGAMDSFSSNTERSYAQTSTSGDHAPKYPLGNFDVKVNGDSLDKTQWIDIPFSELLADGEDSSAMGDNYSPLCLCPIGECVIQPGLNEITYERLGSYNLIISDLIFIGSEFEHVHAAASEWSSNDEQHWHACTALGCPTGKLDVANHTFGEWETTKAATCKEAGERQHTCSVCGKVVKEAVEKIAHTFPTDGGWTQTKAPTCDEAGERQHACTVCNEVVKEAVPALGHSFGDAVVSNAAGEGFIATTGHNCANCTKSALRWSARSYDETLSNGGSKVTVDGLDGVKTGDAENDGGQNNANPAVKVGNHFVYKVKVGAAVEKAGLAFKVKTRAANKAAPVFKSQSSDGKRGNYYDEATQTFTPAPARYGVRINNQEVYFNEDLLALEQNAPAAQILWFDFPLNSFSLIEGVNIIDVYCMGGYSMDAIFEFQLTGLPHVESSHNHNGADAWLSDENQHWHVCTAEGCPIANGIYDKEDHDWNDVVQVTAPTCTAAGAGTKECKVCHKVVDVVIPALGHDISAGTAVKNSDNKDVSPITCSRGDVEGYQMALADYSGEGDTAGAIASDGKLGKGAVMTWKFKLTADGEGHYKTGKVAFIMCARLNGGTAFGASSPADNAFADDYAIAVGSKAGTVTCAGKQLGVNFGATVNDAVYFEFGTIEFEESDLVNGELCIKVTQAANQGYRHRYQDNVRIMYVA